MNLKEILNVLLNRLKLSRPTVVTAVVRKGYMNTLCT